ncbi:MAG: hypothetical protein LIP10_13830 [Clostridiales bacterium]|nr:hypothetical protein [Clostridiales bacterium]
MYNYDDEYNWERRTPRSRRNTMATAALVLGVLSITLCSVFYVSLPCGAIAIICAILSRDNRAMTGKGKAGIICGIIGMVVTIFFTVSAFRYVLTTEDGREYLQYYYRMYTGDYDFDVDETFEELFPFLYDSDESDHNSTQGSGSGNSGTDDGSGSGSYGSGNDGSDDGSDNGTGGSSDHGFGDGFDDGYGNEPGGGGSDRSNGGSNGSGSDEEGGFI